MFGLAEILFFLIFIGGVVMDLGPRRRDQGSER